MGSIMMRSAFSRPSATGKWRCVFAACVLLLGTVVSGKAAAGDPELPGEVLVKLSSTAALGPLLTKHGLSLLSQFGARPIYRLKVVGLADLHDKIDALLRERSVLIAEPNLFLPGYFASNHRLCRWSLTGYSRPSGTSPQGAG